MADFFKQYLAVLRLALDSGWEAQPLSVPRMKANSISRSELRRFVAACHRGGGEGKENLAPPKNHGWDCGDDFPRQDTPNAATHCA